MAATILSAALQGAPEFSSRKLTELQRLFGGVARLEGYLLREKNAVVLVEDFETPVSGVRIRHADIVGGVKRGDAKFGDQSLEYWEILVD